jgi:hypothetical protein
MRFHALPAAAILMVVSASALAQQSGLLLGLSGLECNDDSCTPVARTLWIAPQNDSVKLLATLKDLVVPRRDGFWRVAVRKYCQQPDWSISSEDHLLMVPVNQPLPRPQGDLISCDEAIKKAQKNYDALMAKPLSGNAADDFEANNAKLHGAADECVADSITINFVNPDYISFSSGEAVDCGAHPDGSVSYQVSPLGDQNRSPLPLSFLADAKAKETYDLLAKRALIDNANSAEENHPKYNITQDLKDLSEEDFACFPKFSDSDWFISRAGGRWAAKGGINTHRLCGGEVQFDLPAGLLHSLGIHESAEADLPALQKQLPDALDAFWSPQKDMVVVLTRNQSLKVFRPQQAKLGPPVLTVPLNQPLQERVVMAEWALGSNVNRWTGILTALQKSF